MKKYHIKSLPLKEVVEDFAKEFDTDYSESCREYVLELPPSIGEGEIRGINFQSGLGILNYECRFKEDIEVHFTVNDVHPAKFLYCTQGSLGHAFANESGRHSIDKYQSVVVASNGHNGHILYFKKKQKVRVNSLEINRELFQSRVECNLDSLTPTLQELLTDVDAEKTFYHQGDYSLYLADCLRDMDEFKPSGVLRKLFMEGKSYEMLGLQIIQYEDDLKKKGSRSVIRRSELDKIHEAMRIIQQELPNLETVKELARRVGTNENKLQQGFKNLTGSTINQYTKDARMDAAKELLISSDLSISEIVYSIGLSNRGYFSRIFKEKYNVSPSVFRQGRRRMPAGDDKQDNKH